MRLAACMTRPSSQFVLAIPTHVGRNQNETRNGKGSTQKMIVIHIPGGRLRRTQSSGSKYEVVIVPQGGGYSGCAIAVSVAASK